MSKSRNPNMSNSAAFVVVNVGELTAAHASGGGTVRAHVLPPGDHHAKHTVTGKGSRARSRSWLMEDDGIYKMVCYDGHLEMEHDGRVVWKGKATKDGFETTSTSLRDVKCATLLELALVGEKVKYGAHSGPSRAPASQLAAEKPATEKPAAEKPTAEKPTAKKPTAKKPAAEKRAANKPAANKPAAKRTRAQKPAAKKPAAAEPKGVAGIAAFTVSGQQVRIQHPAGVTRRRIQGILDRLPPGKSRLSTVSKQLAKHGAAFVPWDDGKPGDSGAYETAAKQASPKKTDPAPASGSRPSKRGKNSDAGPPTSRSTEIVDDAKFLADLHAELKKVGAENLFETAKAIWHAGGRQKTLEHMAGTRGRSLVKAFLDWMDKHEQDAQAMLAARAS